MSTTVATILMVMMAAGYFGAIAIMSPIWWDAIRCTRGPKRVKMIAITAACLLIVAAVGFLCFTVCVAILSPA